MILGAIASDDQVRVTPSIRSQKGREKVSFYIYIR
jgi:hypothetical protein